jgi:hypothetical protein
MSIRRPAALFRDEPLNRRVAAMWSIQKNQELKRAVEILLIAVVLLIVFSASGVPMILLSTFSPSSIHWHKAQDHSEEFTFDESAEAA